MMIHFLLAVPLLAAPAATPAAVADREFDVVVIGGTPGGIACAVRTAREGLTTLLVQHNRHVGGMLTNGLFQWDALYAGYRAPIFNEYAERIASHYREKYGPESPQYRAARFTQQHYPMSRFEPSVAEREFNLLIAAEPKLTLLLEHYPSAVERDGATLRSVKLRKYGMTDEITVRAKVFVDAAYEGDLAAKAGVPYRLGREGRDEFDEPHAGKVFTNIDHGQGPRDAVEGRLNLHPYGHVQGSIDPASTFAADRAIQAYNYRFCLSSDPKNMGLPEKPANYDRNEYLHYNRKGMSGGAINGKGTFNSPILPGENYDYPDADWPAREAIIRRHRDFALGLMYFLQNDESVSESKRAGYRRVGLPLDEYADHDNIPYEMYVREARRIVGRYVFRQQDNMLAPGLERTPIFADAVAMTDWSMDSHACSTETRPGYAYDGKLILTEESRPAQIPWRSLLPQGVDNLVVPVCLSATHVAWGAVRLEPVWMQVGEAAGVGATLAVRRGVPVAEIDSAVLVRGLAKRRFAVTFFNDVDAARPEPWVPAVLYFGTRGYFASYDARPDAELTEAVARAWLDGLKNDDPNAVAKAVAAAEREKSKPLTHAAFAKLLGDASSNEMPITRASAIQTLWERLK